MKRRVLIIKPGRASLKNVLPASLLSIIIIAGAILRFTNLNWDSSMAFHPDEPYLTQAATRIRFFSQLNPHFFVYGALPIYVYRTAGELAARATHDPSWATQSSKITLLGRFLSASISTATVGLIYFVGQSYFAAPVGITAAFLLALSPWTIREAHFATPETILIFLLLLLLLQAKRFWENPTMSKSLVLGAIWGLALATKPTTYLFAVVPALVMALTAFSSKHLRPTATKKNLIKFLFWSFSTVAGAITVLFIGSPYTFLDWRAASANIGGTVADILGRHPNAYFTLQFTDTPPYLYQFQTMLWQSGPMVLIGVVALAWLAQLLIKNRDPRLLLFLAFPLIYGAAYGSWFVKFSRYNVLFLPFATIAAAWLIVTITTWIKNNAHRLFLGRVHYWLIGLLVYGIIGLFHVWWGLANWTIYLRPQTRIEASRWIYQNAAPNSVIYSEEANEPLPLALLHQKPSIFRQEVLKVYTPDSEIKVQYLGQKMSQGNFFVFATRRVWATMPRLGKRYPLTSRFYRLFLDGQLGWQEVARFSSYPQLAGISINDDASEETNQIFDHPTVRIFQNISRLSEAQIMQKLLQ